MITYDPRQRETIVYCDDCYIEETFDYDDDPDFINTELQRLGWAVFHRKIHICICPTCMQKKADIL